ncbi:MAG: tetratricopeptide repeat protein [Deltaproteobacteria bacterium]|jgi:tetratricopeptide (TPR) repeat protein|nr:tetratricopeptide repeat protein [Deltaproteobacteria bacterium]
MRWFVIFSILLFTIWSCTAPFKKENTENFMVKRGTNILARGSLNMEKGCFTQAATNFTLAYQDFQASDHLPGMAHALNNLAVCLLELEEYEKAKLFASRALIINRSLDDLLGQAANLSVLGNVHLNKGNDEDAQRLLQEALDKCHGGSPELRSKILNDLSVGLIQTGKIEQARMHLNHAFSLNPDSAAVHQNLGKVAELSGNLREAENHYLKALVLDKKEGYTSGIASDLTVLGNLYLKMERKPEAAEILARALSLRILLNQKNKADDVRKDLRRGGFDVDASTHEMGEEEIPPACR